MAADANYIIKIVERGLWVFRAFKSLLAITRIKLCFGFRKKMQVYSERFILVNNYWVFKLINHPVAHYLHLEDDQVFKLCSDGP